MLYISGNETDFAVSPLTDLEHQVIPNPNFMSLRVLIAGKLILCWRELAILGFLTSFSLWQLIGLALARDYFILLEELVAITSPMVFA
jgi:hypothetical protein